MNETTNFLFALLKCVVHSPLSLSCMTIASGFTEAFWTYSGEISISTPVESETNDAQIMGMLASPLYAQDREASADGHGFIILIVKIVCQVYHLSG